MTPTTPLRCAPGPGTPSSAPARWCCCRPRRSAGYPPSGTGRRGRGVRRGAGRADRRRAARPRGVRPGQRPRRGRAGRDPGPGDRRAHHRRRRGGRVEGAAAATWVEREVRHGSRLRVAVDGSGTATSTTATTTDRPAARRARPRVRGGGAAVAPPRRAGGRTGRGPAPDGGPDPGPARPSRSGPTRSPKPSGARPRSRRPSPEHRGGSRAAPRPRAATRRPAGALPRRGRRRRPAGRCSAATPTPARPATPSRGWWRCRARRARSPATHLEVRPGAGPDAGAAVATDLGSTNGTVVVQPGRGARGARARRAHRLLAGAVVDLGDGISIEVVGPERGRRELPRPALRPGAAGGVRPGRPRRRGRPGCRPRSSPTCAGSTTSRCGSAS